MKIIFISHYILVAFAVLIGGCSVISKEGINSVSMAPDDKTFAFSYRTGNESLIAINNIDEGTTTIVLRSQDGIEYERPTFSDNGQKLYFISRTKRDQGDLYVVNTDGSGLKQITHGQAGAENIQDLSISEDGDTIYYINSGFYGHSSPIAASHPHNLDFYSIDNAGANLERLSYRNSYYLYGISISPSDEYIYSLNVILSLSKPRQVSPHELPPFLDFTSQYPLSNFSRTGNVVLACGKKEKQKPGSSSRKGTPAGEGWAVYGFGLFLIDSYKGTVKEIIHLPSYLNSPALFHHQDRVLFIRNDSIYGGEAGRELWGVNLDGSNLKKIDLRFTKGADIN